MYQRTELREEWKAFSVNVIMSLTVPVLGAFFFLLSATFASIHCTQVLILWKSSLICAIPGMLNLYPTGQIQPPMPCLPVHRAPHRSFGKPCRPWLHVLYQAHWVVHGLMLVHKCWVGVLQGSQSLNSGRMAVCSCRAQSNPDSTHQDQFLRIHTIPTAWDQAPVGVGGVGRHNPVSDRRSDMDLIWPMDQPHTIHLSHGARTVSTTVLNQYYLLSQN